MTDDKKDINCTKTCWKGKFSGIPCLKKATWRGHMYVGWGDGKWHACDEHHIRSDVRIEDDD